MKAPLRDYVMVFLHNFNTNKFVFLKLGPNSPESAPWQSSLPCRISWADSALWVMAFLGNRRTAIVTYLILVSQVVDEDSIEVRAAIKDALDQVNKRLKYNYCNGHKITIILWNLVKMFIQNDHKIRIIWYTMNIQGCEQGCPCEEVSSLANRLQPCWGRTHSNTQGIPLVRFLNWLEKWVGWRGIADQCLQTFIASNILDTKTTKNSYKLSHEDLPYLYSDKEPPSQLSGETTCGEWEVCCPDWRDVPAWRDFIHVVTSWTNCKCIHLN